jgi:DNA topoisomerase I
LTWLIGWSGGQKAARENITFMASRTFNGANNGTHVNGVSLDLVQSAQCAGLRYVSSERSGIRRIQAPGGFRYIDPAGKVLRDPAQLKRIQSLVIPPAWTDVWICPDPKGHIQATGRDARGRKQHRYHPDWRQVRDETKYHRMLQFAKALPKIRRRVKRDMALPGMPREKALALIVHLLEISLIRVGNEEYARDNNSFGLTTMQDNHVAVRGAKVTFRFRGKSGKTHDVAIEDKRLARLVKHCQDLPGQELFQYIDDEGNVRDIDSGDVNDYLREISGQEFTAKDFRTWAGTVLAAMALQELGQFETKGQAKKNIVQAVERVAKRLGNTPAICRKCYVHPAILDAYLEGSMLETLKQRAEGQLAGSLKKLPPEEAAVLGMLQQRLAIAREPLESVLKRELRRRKIPIPKMAAYRPRRSRSQTPRLARQSKTAPHA